MPEENPGPAASPLDLDAEREALAIFCDAIEIAPAELEGWLGRRIDNRPALLQRVRQLIAADAAAAQRTLRSGLDTAWVASPDDPVLPLLPPEQVGPYRLRELIGSGGMGSVYRAERNDGLFEQTVAVKFVRAVRGVAEVRTLIDAERRLLARMQHPGIARILDGGCTDGGLHYLVMEFVDGRAIDEYVREAGLGLRERVALLREVDAAVAHAHGHGVIHCDIKPANILVTADGRARLIDFGVARLQNVLDAALPQGFTLAYASPQRRAGAAPTVADDVFALGVVLAELVSGEAPSPAGVQIGDDVFGPELAAVARRAVAAEPSERYDHVPAFDDDLGRWLALRPVSALPDHWRYRLRKGVQRRPWRAAAAAAAALGLVVSLAVTSLLYGRAETARAEAEARFAEVRSLANYMLFDLDRQLEVTPGATPVRRQMVGRAQSYLDALALHAGGKPALEREVAVGLARLGEVQGVPGKPNVGEPAAARRNLERAEVMLAALTARQPRQWAWRADLGNARYLLALLYGGQDNDPARQLAVARQAEADTAAALAEGERAGAPLKLIGEWQVQLTSSRLVQADALRYQKDLASAAALQQGEERRLQALPAPLRGEIDMPQQLGRIALLLGDSLYYLDRRSEALAAYRRGAAQYGEGLSAAPLNRKLLVGALYGHWFIGSVAAELGRTDEALAESARALALGEQMVLLDPDNRSARRDLSAVRSDRARVLSEAGRAREAVALAEQDLRDREARARATPDDAEAVRDAAVPLRLLADFHERAGDRTTACRWRQRALAAWGAIDRRWGLSALDRSNDVAPLRDKVAACAEAAPTTPKPAAEAQRKGRDSRRALR